MNLNKSTNITPCGKPMLCGALGCVRASVLAFLKQGSSLQQCLIAGVVETAEVYAKMAHNVVRVCHVGDYLVVT